MTDCTENRSFFLSEFLLYHYCDFWYYRSILYYGKLKKSGKNKNELRTIYPKIMKILRTPSIGSGSYKKEFISKSSSTITEISRKKNNQLFQRELLISVLGQLPPRKIVPNSETNPSPNSNFNEEAIFFGVNCLDTVSLMDSFVNVSSLTKILALTLYHFLLLNFLVESTEILFHINVKKVDTLNRPKFSFEWMKNLISNWLLSSDKRTQNKINSNKANVSMLCWLRMILG